MKLRLLPEFFEWMSGLTQKSRKLVDARLERIREYNHLGDTRHLGDGLAELRWKTGMRVYFSRPHWGVLLILGGTKHGQEKDIAKARLLLRGHAGHAP